MKIQGTDLSNLQEIFASLYRIRRVEEEVARVYPTDAVKSPIHLSIGQEAVSVGVCHALRADDVVFPTYRGHAAYLAKGGDLNAMMAELYGKATGCAHGKGGSMHLIDPGAGVMGASAVVATTIPQAVGYALAMKITHSDRLVVTFFGDGAVEEGAFYESLNFAALKNLPILFVCENNKYSIHAPQASRQLLGNVLAYAQSHGVAAERIEGGNVFQIIARTQKWADAARAGETGPLFLECETYRWKEHVGPADDFQAGYRSYAEAQRWIEGDEIKRVGAMMPAVQRHQIEQHVDAEIADAIAFAEGSPYPESDALYEDLYAE